MIGKLTGQLESSGDDWALVDVGGVGYLVFCSVRTLERAGRPGDPVSLLVETHVREDHIHLYGFADPAERIGSAFCPPFRASAPRWRWRCCRRWPPRTSFERSRPRTRRR